VTKKPSGSIGKTILTLQFGLCALAKLKARSILSDQTAALMRSALPQILTDTLIIYTPFIACDFRENSPTFAKSLLAAICTWFPKLLPPWCLQQTPGTSAGRHIFAQDAQRSRTHSGLRK
jgi:hypothetical protein